MPFPVLLDPIAKMVVNLGGISGTLVIQIILNRLL